MLPIEAELHRRETMEGRAAEEEVEEDEEGARRVSCLAVERSMVLRGREFECCQRKGESAKVRRLQTKSV